MNFRLCSNQDCQNPLKDRDGLLPLTSDFFYLDKRIKGGFRSNCKFCQRKSSSSYYSLNKERCNEHNKDRYWKQIAPSRQRKCRFRPFFDSNGLLVKRCSNPNCQNLATLSGNALPATAAYFGKDRRAVGGLTLRCKDCNNRRLQEYYLKHPDKQQEKGLKFRENHPDFHRIYERERRQADLNFRLRKNLQRRISHALHGEYKSARTMKLIGCSIEILKSHLEQQFQPGMTWENYGEWHVDHILPCARFDLRDLEQQRRCFNFSNLQPLWAVDNMRKNDKILEV